MHTIFSCIYLISPEYLHTHLTLWIFSSFLDYFHRSYSHHSCSNRCDGQDNILEDNFNCIILFVVVPLVSLDILLVHCNWPLYLEQKKSPLPQSTYITYNAGEDFYTKLPISKNKIIHKLTYTSKLFYNLG